MRRVEAKLIAQRDKFPGERKLPDAQVKAGTHPAWQDQTILLHTRYLQNQIARLSDGAPVRGIREGCPCLLYSAHSAADIEFIERAFKQSVAEMQSGGFTPGTSDPQFTRESAQTGRLGASAGESAPEFPLTADQREMWLCAQLHPEAVGTFNATWVVDLRGPLQETVLEQAVQRVVDRHEALRACFSNDGESIRILPAVRSRLTQHNLRDLPPHERQPKLETLLMQEAGHLFELGSPPLFRFHLAELDIHHRVLVITVSVTVCDEWALRVVMEELGEIYSSIVEGRPADLKPVVPMRAYQPWLQEPALREAVLRDEAFWLAQHQEPSPAQDLPFSHPRQRQRSYAGDRKTLRLPPDTYAAIKQSARSLQCTPFALLLASFQAWLARLGGSPDLVTGVPFAGQTAMESGRLLGRCVQTLRLRCRRSMIQSFQEWVQDARTFLSDCQEHWNGGFGALTSRMNLNPRPGQLPLVAALVNLDPPMDAVRFSGLKHSLRSGPQACFQYDLGFNLIEEEEGLTVEFHYSSSLLTTGDAEGWLRDYGALLQAALQDPGRTIESLPMPHCDGRGIALKATGEARCQPPPTQRTRTASMASPPCALWVLR